MQPIILVRPFPELAGEHHKGWMLRFNWIQRQEYYRGRRQDEGQTKDLA